MCMCLGLDVGSGLGQRLCLLFVVANAWNCLWFLLDVKVEQVVDDYWGRLSSFVQLRASIPVFWSQIGNIATPKPPILLGPVDPTFKAAQYVENTSLCCWRSGECL